MKKVITLLAVLATTSSFAASINWGTTSAATFGGTKMGGVSARLIIIGAADLASGASFTITESSTISSLAGAIGTDTGTAGSTTSTASGMGKGKVAGTYTFDTGLNDGDYVAVLLSYVSEGTTWYNLTSTSQVSYNAVAGVWNNSSNAANWSFSGGSADDSKTGNLAVGGGWTAAAVPEPSTAVLALAGLALLLKRRKA